MSGTDTLAHAALDVHTVTPSHPETDGVLDPTHESALAVPKSNVMFCCNTFADRELVNVGGVAVNVNETLLLSFPVFTWNVDGFRVATPLPDGEVNAFTVRPNVHVASCPWDKLPIEFQLKVMVPLPDPSL